MLNLSVVQSDQKPLENIANFKIFLSPVNELKKEHLD